MDDERNAGLQLAQVEWVLALDSEEVLLRALKSELEMLIREDSCDIIYVARKTYVAGCVLKSSYPDRQAKSY